MIKKTDIFVSLAIGLVAGALIAFVLSGFSEDVPLVEIVPFWVWPVCFPFFCLAWFVFAQIVGVKIPIFKQLGKFILVGGLNFLIDLGVLNALIIATGISVGWAYSLFKAVAFIVAVVNSYLMNKFWTFDKQKIKGDSVEKTGKEALTFLVVSGAGMLMNNITASLVVNVIGPQWGISENLWANVGAVSAGFVAMFWNFIGYKFIVFKGR